jgi:hypothetical protein
MGLPETEECNHFDRYRHLLVEARKRLELLTYTMNELKDFYDHHASDEVKKEKLCAALIVMIDSDVVDQDSAWESVESSVEPYNKVLTKIITEFPDLA